MHSIRFKITAIAIAEILTAVLCVFLISFSTIQGENDSRSVEIMNLIAQDTQKSLEKYTEGIEQSVEMVSNLASDTLDSAQLVQAGVIGANATPERTPEQTAQLDAYLAVYSKEIQTDFASVASHTRGTVSYYYCITPDISTAEHGFFYSRVGKTGFSERDPIDARELDSTDLLHTTWYYTPIQRGRPSWIGPYTAHFLDEMRITSYIAPIYKSGALVGVLGMDIPVDTLVSLVSSIRVYDTGFAYLLDADGHVLYYPDMEAGTTLDLPVNEQLLAQKDNGNELIRYMYGGQEHQISFTTLSNGMKLAVVAPTSEINASSIRLLQTIPPIALALIAVFAILTLFVMRYLTNPLLRLTAASQRLANEDYDVELDYKGHDEVGALTESFQSMRGQLQAYIEDLNRRIHADDLTGLANQRYFFELATEERAQIIANGESPVILYFNLIGMKHYNRQYGFDEGDRLICEMADILVRHFGRQRISRFGQDHFAVITTDDHLQERIAEVFASCKVANDSRMPPVSVGIYPCALEEVAISVACDRAKYACDQRGNSYFSGCRYFDSEMIKQVEVLRHIINTLDQAIEEKWIKVFYQPIVRAVNGKVCDEEALSRWFDPEWGPLSPGDFIPALEDAGLIYRLDLYVLDEILAKMKYQASRGFTVVSHSVNLSRSDFDSCDMVEEIRERVDAAGIPRGMISIEITESIIGSDFEFMKKQVERFQELGFPVWMDDFGSGYSSLDYLQSIQFDLIKFDMSFLRKLDQGESGKIILTELMQMATALGVDTICEGVESKEHVRFLQEIGCSKLQGYYFSKPMSFEEILERHEEGLQIGYENPEESAYYQAIGKANLYDLTTVVQDDEDGLQNFFDTIPMSIMEVTGNRAAFVRMNQSYRELVVRYFEQPTITDGDVTDLEQISAEEFFARHAVECREEGSRIVFDERMPDGSIAHYLVKWIGANSVTGTKAVAIAVLSIVEPDEGASYANIARALAMDYYKIFYVNLANDHYIAYSSPMGGDGLAVERHGEDFFADAGDLAQLRVDSQDQTVFFRRFTKEKLLKKLKDRGVFTSTYRLVDEGAPVYANMKVTQLEPEGRHIVIGISVKDIPLDPDE